MNFPRTFHLLATPVLALAFALAPTPIAVAAALDNSPADPAAILAQPPPPPSSAEAATPRGAPLRPGLFWLGVDGHWANSEYADETLRLIHDILRQNLAVVMIANKPDRFKQPPVYNQLNIPTIIQTWGSGYEPWLRSQNAFEINWAGDDLSNKTPRHALSGTAHAAALPHPATRQAFLQLGQSAIRSGYSGHGFCDMVWMWGGGRGSTGHNPATIAAFRADLLGADDGLRATLDNGPARTIKLRDYADYYLGGLPAPQTLGLQTWADYTPPRKPDASQPRPPSWFSEYILFDILVHYEWLKFARLLGDNAEREGGFFQCMPNPEDMANGCDFLFLNALDSVRVTSEEFFQNVSHADGAYYRQPYLTSPQRAPRQNGLVLESGGGGNQWPYYAHEIAWLDAYELTAATAAAHLEGDFWPGARRPLDEVLKNPAHAERARQILHYGLGFLHAREDQPRRPAPDFVSITSRRIFRPWGDEWRPWNWRLDTPLSPDLVLAQNGFLFTGMGEEALQNLNQTGDPILTTTGPILYSPTTATEKGWLQLLRHLETGAIPGAIAVAQGIDNIIRTDFTRQSLATLTPAHAVKPRLAGLWSGPLRAGPATLLAEASLAGPLYAAAVTNNTPAPRTVITLGGQPLVLQTTVGTRPLYTLLFDPGLPENAPVTAAVYEHLLATFRIAPRWKTDPGAFARVYRANNDTLIIGVQSPEVRDWSRQTQGRPSPTAKIAYANPDKTLRVRIMTPGALSPALTPGTTALWLALPSGQRGETTLAPDGTLALQIADVAWQTFHVLSKTPANATRLDALASARRQALTDALTLKGRAPLPPAAP